MLSSYSPPSVVLIPVLFRRWPHQEYDINNRFWIDYRLLNDNNKDGSI
jgi:hypothetical protein